MMQKVWKNQKGFSLIELIIVIAILAVIAAIAIPNLLDNINNSRKRTDIANAKLIGTAISQAYAENEAIVSTAVGTAQTAAGSINFETAVAPAVTNVVIAAAITNLQNVPTTKFSAPSSAAGTPFKVYADPTSGTVVVMNQNGVQLFPVPATPYN